MKIHYEVTRTEWAGKTMPRTVAGVAIEIKLENGPTGHFWTQTESEVLKDHVSAYIGPYATLTFGVDAKLSNFFFSSDAQWTGFIWFNDPGPGAQVLANVPEFIRVYVKRVVYL